jgi:hypothetical protein
LVHSMVWVFVDNTLSDKRVVGVFYCVFRCAASFIIPQALHLSIIAKTLL